MTGLTSICGILVGMRIGTSQNGRRGQTPSGAAMRHAASLGAAPAAGIATAAGHAAGTDSSGPKMPWSYRFGAAARLVITACGAVAVAVVGMMAHRMGASANVPYGLVLGLCVVGLSTWCARSRSGAVGLAVHLIVSSAVAWGMAIFNPGGGALTPIGFGGAVPFFSEHAGYMWLFGMIAVQIVLLCCPARWFSIAGAPDAARSRRSRV